MQVDTLLPKTKIDAISEIIDIPDVDGKAMLRLLIWTTGDDPDKIPLKKLGQLSARLALIGKPARPWSAKYLRNVCHGTQKASPKLIDAIMRVGMIEDGTPDILALGHDVTVLALGRVDAGAVLQVDSRICPACKIAFIPRSWNQKYYPAECNPRHRHVK